MFRVLRILRDLFFRPRSAWAEVREDKGILPAVSFFLVAGALVFAIPLLVATVTNSSLEAQLDADAKEDLSSIAERLNLPESTIMNWAYFGGILLFFFTNALIVLIAVVVVGWFGGAGSWMDTVRVALYGAAPALLFGQIPILGVVALLYSLWLRAYGLHEVHNLSYGKAFGVVLVVGALFFVASLAFFLLFFALGFISAMV